MNITFSLKFIQFSLLSFDRSKERSKEKSPACDKLPEIFALRKYSEFLSAIYHRRVS
ncbi:MAG: hypothetical protein M3R36_07530 [Bacteroidota bacterium]|nr:hypothetical protein [Bacteroidota bacterium]